MTSRFLLKCVDSSFALIFTYEVNIFYLVESYSLQISSHKLIPFPFQSIFPRKEGKVLTFFDCFARYKVESSFLQVLGLMGCEDSKTDPSVLGTFERGVWGNLDDRSLTSC